MSSEQNDNDNDVVTPSVVPDQDETPASEQALEKEEEDEPTQTTQEETNEEEKAKEEEEGPLRKLTTNAANSTIGRRVSGNVPSAALPYIEKVQPVTDKAIDAVDTTLRTDEAKRVASSTVDLVHAVTAFTLLLLTWTVSSLESTLQLSPPQSANQSETARDDTEQQEANEGYKKQAVDLFYRYKAVSMVLFSKASSMCKNQGTQTQTQNEKDTETETETETKGYDPHSIDKVVVKHVKKGAQLAKQVSAYSLSRASQFSGPGSSAVKPTAEYIISKLPDDAKKVVSESTSPFQ